MTPAAEKLRTLLAAPGCLHLPTCFDGLSARLVQQSGHPLTFMSGAAVAATRFGLPDIGLVTMVEMADQLRCICAAAPDLVVLADGDTGYGNAASVRRTIAEFACAGAACVMIEDQQDPKRCGHFEGKTVVSRVDARLRVRAAVAAAREYGVLLIARTDARAVEGFGAALERCEDFVEEGADIIFLEAPASERELRDFAGSIPRPTLANLVPGGKTPLVSRDTLSEMGFKIAVYHPLLFAVIGAMQSELEKMKSAQVPETPPVTFGQLKDVLGLAEFEDFVRRFAP
jgi:2-methylisocitrate lyase-like PEP mutase family enzyme